MNEDTGTLGVVIDVGSQNTKAGFVNEPSPRVMVASTVGRFRRPGLADGFPSIYCGEEAIKNRGLSNLVWPVQEGSIKHWDEMEILWHHMFYKELYVPPECTRIMHVVHPLIPLKDKEKMAEILFESFTVNSIYLGKSPNLVLYASGRTSGVVVENGYACSHVAPVFEGFHLKNSTVVSPLAGKVLTERLQKLLLKLGYSFTTPIEIDLLNNIKRDICYVAQDYEKEIANTSGYDDKKVKYDLPDGSHVLLGEERFQAAEIWFKPELDGYQCRSLVEDIVASINLCDIDYRKIFYNNIVLSGGSTLFPGLVERIVQDLSVIIKPKFIPKIEAMDFRQFAAWTGGSITGSLSTLKDFWLTKQEYDDCGTDRVKYKFF